MLVETREDGKTVAEDAEEDFRFAGLGDLLGLVCVRGFEGKGEGGRPTSRARIEIWCRCSLPFGSEGRG